MAESAIQAAIIKRLGDHGAYVVKVHQEGRQRRGIPDVLACYRGIYLAIEVKRPGGQLTDHQRHQLHAIHRAGGATFVLDNADRVEKILAAIDRCVRANLDPRCVSDPLAPITPVPLHPEAA